MTNLIYDLVIHLVDEGRITDIVYLDFSKSPTVLSWKSWQTMVWTGTHFAG